MKYVIEKPLITEKTFVLAGRGWYTFAVAVKASKGQIARDIHTLYAVTVTNVRTVIMHGKTRRSGKSKVAVQLPEWKKAIVQLVKGQKIDAFEVPQEEEKKK
ncbi:50S ribosomal protein L23 [Candidatus Gottesmanbacteria bacterium]|nr:50S ribosomal protein L23 [Candidatus Gottesmanbacteria bacterium]